MSEFDLLSLAADGMNVQRTVLDVAARNVAAAQAATPDHPYPRLVARFAGGPNAVGGSSSAGASGSAAADGIPDPGEGDGDVAAGEGLAGAEASDGNGGGTRFVGTARSGESADALTEMIAVLDAQRAYEASASIFDIGKRLAERTLTVGQS